MFAVPAAVSRIAGVPDRGGTIVSRLRKSPRFREFQEAFEATTGLPMILREAGSFRTPMQGSKRINPFCALMTRSNKTCASCLLLQQQVERAATQGPKTLQCYAGLSETAVPIRIGNRVIGYLQTGQVFFRAPSKSRFNAFARAHAGSDLPELETAYLNTRVVARKQYRSIIRLVAIFSEHLAIVCNQILISEATDEPLMVKHARRFILEHQGEVLGLKDVAREVKLSTFYFCKVFKETTGCSFTEYLARERIESVKRRLLNIQTRISEAAYASGFQSLSQFNRVFSRYAGESPSCYRSRIHRAEFFPAVVRLAEVAVNPSGPPIPLTAERKPI